MAQASSDNFGVKISLESPLKDYQKIVSDATESEDATDEERQNRLESIFAATRNTIWKLLFAKRPPSLDDQKKAGDLLVSYKQDACFYNPWTYNDWIPSLRDELLKYELLEFWHERVVKEELGPCWARDSDYFDNIDDPVPEEFYKFGGCTAPFKAITDGVNVNESPTNNESSVLVSLTASVPDKDVSSALPVKISLENPVADYGAKIKALSISDVNHEDKYNDVFNEAREVIWQLLFGENTLSQNNFRKAADMLDAYKRDACFYNPYDYNDWIPKVRDELFVQKYFDFWKTVIVEKELGLCWCKDSDYFDDEEDTRPFEFYTSGDGLMFKT